MRVCERDWTLVAAEHRKVASNWAETQAVWRCSCAMLCPPKTGLVEVESVNTPLSDFKGHLFYSTKFFSPLINIFCRFLGWSVFQRPINRVWRHCHLHVSEWNSWCQLQWSHRRKNFYIFWYKNETEFESGGFSGRRVLPSVAPTPPKKPNLLKWPENLIKKNQAL